MSSSSGITRRACIAALALAPGACGFQLRGQATYTFASIYINAPATPIFRSQLTRALEGGGNARVLPGAEGAQVILDVPAIVDEKDVLSLSSGGSVREYALAMRLSFRLHDANGLDWLPPGEIVLRRSYTFNESEVLARDAEEQRLLREMQSDAVAQLVRRLQAARKPV
ncbi:MAG: LPS assembly lipoprotein LptE [Betaproteobacteria bacterium]